MRKYTNLHGSEKIKHAFFYDHIISIHTAHLAYNSFSKKDKKC